VTVRWSKRALQQVADIYTYIAQDSERAAARVADGLLNAARGLAEHPMLGRPGRQPGTRELVVGRYVLVYRIKGAIGTVVYVIHGARRADNY
jgi:toxin ParE1/3/4